jgi:hypothetical protein
VKKGWGGARGGCVAMEGEGSGGGGGGGEEGGEVRGGAGEGAAKERSEYVGLWNSRIAEEQ